MIHKGLFFIFKGVTVKYKELHSAKTPLISQRQAAQTVLCFSKRKKSHEEKEKKRARSSALKKSHNTNTKFHYGEVTITSEGYKIFLCISEIIISKTVRHIGQHSVKAEITRQGKRKRRGEEKRKRRREGKRKRRREGKKKRKRKKRRKRKAKRMEKAGLKSFPLEARRLSEYVP